MRNTKLPMIRLILLIGFALCCCGLYTPYLAAQDQPPKDRKIAAVEAKIARLNERLTQCQMACTQADSTLQASRKIITDAEDSLRFLTQYEKQLGENTFAADKQSRQQIRSASDEEIDSLRAEHRHRERAIDALYKSLDKRFKEAHRLYERGLREQERAKQRLERAQNELKEAKADIKKAQRELEQAEKNVTKRAQEKEKNLREKQQRAQAKEKAKRSKEEKRAKEKAKREKEKQEKMAQ